MTGDVSLSRSLGIALALALALALGAPATGRAETRLGEQRAGTSSGAFLKIPVDPRGAALGGAFVAGVEGVAALTWNPAALTSLRSPELMFSYVRWPGDIDYTYFAAATYWGRVNGTVGVQMGYLGTVMDETTEEYPQGTGRNFGVRDWYVAASYARQFTDQLSFGATLRFVGEDLGTEVGGPSSYNVLGDLGTLYFLPFFDARLAFSLQHFGPEFTPSGSYESAVTGEETSYQSFAPPTVFRLGLSLKLLDRGPYALRSHTELNHFADAAETIKFGGELELDHTLYLRTGYDLSADTMKFSAGAGFHTRFGFNTGDFDYAFTDGGPLGAVHRLAIRITL